MNLPFLKGRLIIHVDCNELKANAKRAFFSSTREQLKETSIKREILREIIEFVKGDDQLQILNEEAAKEDAKNANLQNKEHLKKEVVKFLNLRNEVVLIFLRITQKFKKHIHNILFPAHNAIKDLYFLEIS